MKICILIPVYNEANALGPIIQEVKKKNLDVVVIDDGSSDDSAKIAKAEGAVLIQHEKNMGKGSSLRDGFQYVLEKQYDGVITMDGDGQHAVEDLDHFIAAAEKYGSCVINGNRMSDVRSMPLIRALTNRFMSALISMACGQKIPDTQCGYRYISVDILKNLTLECSDYEIETEVLMKTSKRGVAIKAVPVKTIYRNEVSKINPIRDTIRFFRYFIKELFSKK